MILDMKNSTDYYEMINNDEMRIQSIQMLLLKGLVTEEGLLTHTNIDQTLLNKIKRYIKYTDRLKDNNIPLLENSTDIFFFGIRRSGKSCIVSSIFNYAEREGLFIDNRHNRPMALRNYLQGRPFIDLNHFNSGTLPDLGQTNYTATELHLNGEIYPLNFIEMSGEFFYRAAKDPSFCENAIDVHGYLSNSNKKLLFFIVDYNMYNEGESSEESTKIA